MRHLVIGQRQKAPNFSAFHWSPNGCLITIGQHFVTTRVVHLPKRTETSLITESDQSRASHQLLQLCPVRTAWSDSDQSVRAVHNCKSWFYYDFDYEKILLIHSGGCPAFVTYASIDPDCLRTPGNQCNYTCSSDLKPKNKNKLLTCLSDLTWDDDSPCKGMYEKKNWIFTE